MTNTLKNVMRKCRVSTAQQRTHAICLRIKGGGAFGDLFGQGDKAENIM